MMVIHLNANLIVYFQRWQRKWGNPRSLVEGKNAVVTAIYFDNHFIILQVCSSVFSFPTSIRYFLVQ